MTEIAKRCMIHMAQKPEILEDLQLDKTEAMRYIAI